MNPALISLVIFNCVPLIGVAFFDWSLFSVMLVYWLENVIVGIWNVVKMITAKEARESVGGTLFICLFFIFHYGLFCFVHGIFVFVLFGGAFEGMPFGADTSPEFKIDGFAWPVLVAAFGLFVSHGISYFTNYLGKGEYLEANSHDLMEKPYGRMMLLHVTIVIGGGLVMVLGQPILALVILVVLKIGFDIRAHRKSHSMAQIAKEA